MQRRLDKAVPQWSGRAWTGSTRLGGRGLAWPGAVGKGTAGRLWNSVFRRGGAGSGASCRGGQGETRRGKAPAWLVGARRFRFGLLSCGVVAQGPAGHGVSWRLTQGVLGLGVVGSGLAVKARHVPASSGVSVLDTARQGGKATSRHGTECHGQTVKARYAMAWSVMGVSP